MQRARWIHAAALMALVVSTVAVGATQPARATAAEAAAAKSGMTSRLEPLTVTQATTEQIRDMAAKGNGQLLTLQPTTGVMSTITCYLVIGHPYGGGAPSADVLIDAVVFCDDWVHLASLSIDLWRDTSLVASGNGSFPYTYGVIGTVGVTDCTPGNYWGMATATVYRYDFSPPSAGATVYSYPAQIGCGSSPPPPPPSSPVNAYLNCGTGAATIFCEVHYSGTVGPVTIRWYVDGTYWSHYDDSTWASIGCSPGQVVRVRAAVSASNGSDIANASHMSCTNGPPDW